MSGIINGRGRGNGPSGGRFSGNGGRGRGRFNRTNRTITKQNHGFKGACEALKDHVM